MLDEKPVLIKLIESSHYAETVVIYMLAHEKHKAEEILDKIAKLDASRKDQIMNALQRVKQRAEEILKKVSKLDPKRKERIMNELQRIEQRGIQIGRREVKRNIARQMLAENERIKDITRWTGLTPGQILALKD